MTLVPNSPSGRMRHVIKTYRHSKSPFVAVDTMRIALAMMGRDAAATRMASMAAALGLPRSFAYSEPAAEDDWKYFHDQIAAPWNDEYLPERHEYDFMIPWIARELGRLAKAVHRGHGNVDDYHEAKETLYNRAPAIAMWATRERVDIGRTSLAEALEAIRHFDAFAGEMPQGEVVYEFEDGYTLQRIWKPEQLEAEGAAMQHCVGDYCLDEGDPTHIYSLRDERGMPHVTMEYDIGTIDQGGHFVQIYGKQNEGPVAKYRPYLKTVIEELFHGDPLGLLMARVEPREIDFSGEVYENVDFTNHAEHLREADFSNAVITDCDFATLRLDYARFSKASVTNCSFVRCQMTMASFTKAELLEVNFREAELVRAKFEEASLQWVNFGEADLLMASFEHARFAPMDGPPPSYLGTLRHVPRSTWKGKTVIFPRHQLGSISFRNSNIGIEYVAPTIRGDPSLIPAALTAVERVFDPDKIKNTPLWQWYEEHGDRAEEVPYEASDG